MRLLRVSNTVYIWLGLEDGSETVYPRVTLYEPGSATAVQTVDLTHKVLGVYQNSFSYSGAAIDVLAVGIIYSNSGHTLINTAYKRVMEVFHIDDSGTAAAVKTALEADGSKLDHLWEMTEDDGGVRRLTENALEEAPGVDAAAVRVELDANSTIRKMLTNRKAISVAAKTLTVYEDDGTTPLVVFDLKNFAGEAAVVNIADVTPE